MSIRPNQLKQVQEEAHALFTSKNADYGDAFANHGPIGVLVRLGDKIQRLQKITKTKVHLVKTESLRDSLIDLHNYAAMAVMLLDENNLDTTIYSDSEDEYVSDIIDHGNQLVLTSAEQEDQEEQRKYSSGTSTDKCNIQ